MEAPELQSGLPGKRTENRMSKTTRKTASYRNLARQMREYFLTYDEPTGAPSFGKFAKAHGCTVGDLSRLRSHAGFDLVYRECLEIRRDYLVDKALTKTFDPTFVKYLLSSEEVTVSDGQADGFSVTVEVIGDGENASEDNQKAK